jgi:hypothetical protein
MKQNVSKVDANGDGVSCLAFQLWEEAGCPEGRDLEFWLRAETSMPDAAKAAEAAELDSASILEEIQARESTLTPIVETFLPFKTLLH